MLPERVVVGDSGHIDQHDLLLDVSEMWVKANLSLDALRGERHHGRDHELLKAWFDAISGDPEPLPELPVFPDAIGVPQWHPGASSVHRLIHERLHALYNRLPVMDGQE